MKLGKCIESFTLNMKVDVKIQWSIGVVFARGHKLDTWHVNKNPNQKWPKATLGLRGSQAFTITLLPIEHMTQVGNIYVLLTIKVLK